MVLALVALVPRAAWGSATATIDVYPGPHALADAIDAASAGDTLRIHTGQYPESVVVDKGSLTLVAAGDGPVTVDGQCATRIVIRVVVSGVTIDGLRVTGATEGFGNWPSEIAFLLVSNGTVRNTSLLDTCDAEYGINLYASIGITMQRNVASGFSDAGIYIGHIPPSLAGVTATGNDLFVNSRGIIVEDSSGVPISLRGNRIHDNTSSGIFLTDSDGVEIRSNRAMRASGGTGIELDSLSDDNLIGGNTALGNQFDLANEGGTGNCWIDNTYETSTGDVSC
jgi:parallel beta-helix repeat protein